MKTDVFIFTLADFFPFIKQIITYVRSGAVSEIETALALLQFTIQKEINIYVIV